jgi:hypothetical protein
MKQIKFVIKIVATVVVVICTSCKKTNNDAFPSSSSLGSGRAAISFQTDANFGNSKAFNIRNTSETKAIIKPFGSGNLRTIVLEASERYGAFGDTRLIHLDILVLSSATSNGSVNIDMSLVNGNPQAHLRLVYTSMQFGGGTLRSTAGRLTITKLTATEIEGNFSSTASLNITNGFFAGRF